MVIALKDRMIRGYQFNKVEIFQYTKEQDSSKAFEEMVAHAAGLVEKLGLHFQISKLAAGDCSHSMARLMILKYIFRQWVFIKKLAV